MIEWTEDGRDRSVRWHSENGSAAPQTVQVIGDETSADAAYRLARSGVGLLWRGDFHNGRQLLQAMDRRLRRENDRGRGRGRGNDRGGRGRDRKRREDHAGRGSGAQAFFSERQRIAERARLLGHVIVELGPDLGLELRRAPDTRAAALAAYGRVDGPMCVSLTELGGVLSAHQWQLRGVSIPALGADIHPRYGVFSPVRGEYLDLVAQTPLPAAISADTSAAISAGSDPGAATHDATAFDLGTGTGVLAAILARCGLRRIVGTDINPRAVACARENLERLCPQADIEVVETDLFPTGRADLIVCNPPWLPAQPTSALETGIYDPESTVLHRFIAELPEHLTPNGEGWLIISDLAELLGLRPPGEVVERIEAAGLRVIERRDTAPRHARAQDGADALHAARSAEVTSLWRLGLTT